MITAGRAVVKKLCRASDRRDYNVNFSVVVKIPKRRAPVSCAQSRGGSGFGAPVLKSCVPPIFEDTLRLPILLSRGHPPGFSDVRGGAYQNFLSLIFLNIYITHP